MVNNSQFGSLDAPVWQPIVSLGSSPEATQPGLGFRQSSRRNERRETNINPTIEIEVLPGPSAFLTALIGSGLPTDKFLFLGFLPKKGLENYLSKYKDLEVTIIFYESPNRILKTLDVIEKVFVDVQIVIAREISKIYEEYIRGNLREIKEKLKNKKLKGEITVVLRKKV